MDLASKRKAIADAFGTSAVGDDLIDMLARMAQEAYFPKRGLILGMGERQRYLYLVIRGMARSYYLDENGNDFTKLFVREGEFFIGEALFMDESLEAFEAVEDLTCLRFEAAPFKDAILSAPASTAAYITALEATIRYKMRREHDLQCLDATDRYLVFRETYPGIEDRLSQNLIASYLGVTKETLSRIRGKLQSGNIATR